VASFDGRRDLFEPRGEFEAQYMSVAPASAARQRAQVVRAGLESLAIAMRDDADAAKAIIIVTEGFRATEPTRTRTTTLRSIARAARLSNIPIYIVDPSADAATESEMNPAWSAVASETGGVLFPPGSDLNAAFNRVASELEGRYVLEFQGASTDDGAFHRIDVKVKRKGAQVRAPSGYWAPFGASRFPAMKTGPSYASLLTPHVSGLIQPWFRMAPGRDGSTRVTFSWVPRAVKNRPERVDFTALTFEGKTVHAARLDPLDGNGEAVATTFDVAPGPLQVSMSVASSGRHIDTEVRYIEVPRLDATKPFLAAVEFIRPRSLPEFLAMQSQAGLMPTEVREFLRRDRLLVRVRAFSSSSDTQVTVRLLNRLRQPLMELPALARVDGAAQFDLPFARFAKGDYLLEITAVSGSESITQIQNVRLIG
jgi:hypothetical protein